MTTFTLEIAGKPIACICAADLNIAENIIDEPWFCTDLVSLQSEGEPLWDGMSTKRLRRATLAEGTIVRDRISASGRADHDDDETVFYLVPVTEVPRPGNQP